MRFRQIASAVLWTAMVVSAQAGRALVPIQPAEAVLATTRGDMTELAIRQGAARRGWVPQVLDADLVRCRLSGKYLVVVDVQHTANAITVRFESTTLPHDSAMGTIHPKYKSWVANLVKDIQVEANRLGPGPYPPLQSPSQPAPPGDCSHELAEIQRKLDENRRQLADLKGRQLYLAGRQQELEESLERLEARHNQGSIPDWSFEEDFMENSQKMAGINDDIEDIMKRSIPEIQQSISTIQTSLAGIQDCLTATQPESLREVKDTLEQIKKAVGEIEDSLANPRRSR